MSKRFKTYSLAAAVFLFILQIVNNCAAQAFDATMAIDGATAAIAVKFTGPAPKVVSFATSRAGVGELDKRISELKFFDEKGAPLPFRVFGPGALAAERPAASLTYRLTLAPARATDKPHVSWIDGDAGMIFGADALPLVDDGTPANIAFKLPGGWLALSADGEGPATSFRTSDAARGAFFLAPSPKTSLNEAGGRRMRTAMTGDWKFADADFAAMSWEIENQYVMLFGGIPSPNALVVLGRLPDGAGWEAETRGSTVVIFSGDMSFRTQSEQRLHEQLRHELFHLWVPNGVNLSGSYDWFYEGFALYASLKLAATTGRIRFEDFLDTLSRAHSIDSATRRRKPLADASRDRWNGANTQVYARGMIVAFLADLVVMRDTKGKSDVGAILRAIYEKHRPPAAREDGNAAVLRELAVYPGLAAIVESYVKGVADIAWQTELAAAGIESTSGRSSTKLSVRAKPDRRQKDLLDKLGYNAWRKKAD